jgi:hypothetical protein
MYARTRAPPNKKGCQEGECKRFFVVRLVSGEYASWVRPDWPRKYNASQLARIAKQKIKQNGRAAISSTCSASRRDKIRSARQTAKAAGQNGKSHTVLVRRTALWLFAGLAGMVIFAAVLAPRVAQPLSYHKFADTRCCFGIANFGDVASNIPFAILGICGMVALRKNGSIAFLDARERWPYLIIFAGFLLTAFGSSYYHLQPGNARLV